MPIEFAALLEDLDERLDDEVEDELLDAWQCFADGREKTTLFSPKRRKRSDPGTEWPKVPINAALCDQRLMALSQYAEVSRALAAGSGAVACVRANYGTGILPSLFGAEVFVMPEDTDTLPTVLPLGPERCRALIERGVPDLCNGFGEAVFAMGRYYSQIGERYPRIGRHVHIYHPDLQGPMDVVELLYGSELFVALVEEPELIHELLALVTRTYVAFFRRWEELVPPRDRERFVHWGYLQRGRIFLRDDSAMNLSPAMYDEFVRPYDEELLRTCGGGALHFCGRGDHYIRSASTLCGLSAVNLSQPHLNDMEVIYAATVDRGIKLVGLDRRTAEHAISQNRDLRGSVHCF
jgi:hypothetical protein